MSMQAGMKGAYDCVKAFSETDLTEDLKRIDVPWPTPPRSRTGSAPTCWRSCAASAGAGASGR